MQRQIGTKEQTTAYKTLHRKLNIKEQHSGIFVIFRKYQFNEHIFVKIFVMQCLVPSLSHAKCIH
jgi:hypothetical protein